MGLQWGMDVSGVLGEGGAAPESPVLSTGGDLAGA